MRIYADRNQFMASLFTAGEMDIRGYLNGVHVEATSGETRLVSTDGHIASVQRQFIENEVEGLATVTVPRDRVALVKGKGTYIEIVCEDGEWSLNYDGLKHPFTPVEGSFPDYRRILPTTPSGVAGQYNPSLIARFSKAAKALGLRSGTLYIEQSGLTSAAAVMIPGHPNYFGVLMPFRVVEKASTPRSNSGGRENLAESLV